VPDLHIHTQSWGGGSLLGIFDCSFMKMRHGNVVVEWLSNCSAGHVLFSKEKSTRTSAVFDDLDNLHKAEKHHPNIVAHTLYLENLKFSERIRELSTVWGIKLLALPSFMHSVVCLTIGPYPLPKRVLHRVRTRASSFNFQYLLFSLRSSSSCLRLLPRLFNILIKNWPSYFLKFSLA
jgi:hypothetical protein